MQSAFDEAFDTLLSTDARRVRLDEAIEQPAVASPFAQVMGRLGCLRGVSPLTAFGLAVEVGDWCPRRSPAESAGNS
ncbi:hypothetical protein [Streptomyces sp. NBC_01615]|uniref:hypothetical protein n=1 Tax=Streptomyces sp. NBC_01615 TaxID=2975898 RepID=UPI00386A27DA